MPPVKAADIHSGEGSADARRKDKWANVDGLHSTVEMRAKERCVQKERVEIRVGLLYSGE